MKESEDGLVERGEKESAVEYLYRMRDMGFLFHGTAKPQHIELFEPRQASDPNKEWNSQVAVYASSEPIWSVIFAIYKGKSPWRTTFKNNEKGRITEITAHLSDEFRDTLSDCTGHVYILPREGFERENEHSAQWRSKDPVAPVASVEVNLQDYFDMGGKIVWKQI